MDKERFEVRHCGDWNSYLYDNEKQQEVDISIDEFVKLFNQQDKEIKRIKEEISIIKSDSKNVLVSQFAIDEDVYIIWHGMVIDVEIKAIGKDEYYVDTCHFDLAEGWGGIFVDKDEVFKTKEDAESKLKELQDE